MLTFGELEVGEKFVPAVEGASTFACQKKSGSSAYDLQGGKNGELILIGKSFTTSFKKGDPVYRLAL